MSHSWLQDRFSRVGREAAHLAGRPEAFIVAVLVIILWAVCGPVFNFSDTWQLIINTGTTIITFLMVFLVQSAQNRDSAAINLKLDELIRATQDARNRVVAVEEDTEETLERLKKRVRRDARKTPI